MSVQFPVNSVAAIISVHALYTFADPQVLISRMTAWLRPGGLLFACDLGLPMDVRDWATYLFRSSLREKGLLRTVALFVNGREIATQNRRIREMQLCGRYWMHSLQQFVTTFEQNRLIVEEAFECYRGYSHAVVCRKLESGVDVMEQAATAPGRT